MKLGNGCNESSLFIVTECLIPLSCRFQDLELPRDERSRENIEASFRIRYWPRFQFRK